MHSLAPLSVEEVLKATGGKLKHGNTTKFAGVSTDTRKVAKNNLFIPLKGNRFDGHDFISNAFAKGVSGTLIEHNRTDLIQELMTSFPNHVIVSVDNALHALGNLGKFHREKIGVKTIGITGSTGKTTTKELIASVTSLKYKTMKTEGNLNNLIGLPLTLLSLTPGLELAVVEMGTSVPGEMKRLCEIAKPDIAVLTNISRSHLEGLGNIAGVAKEKGEILRGISENGICVVNGDDPFIADLASKLTSPCITFGLGKRMHSTAKNISYSQSHTRFLLTHQNCEIHITLNFIGSASVYNGLAAACTGLALGMEPHLIKEGLEKVKPMAGRLNLKVSQKGFILIDDTYNANPLSMRVAFDTVKRIGKKKRKVAILGDMLELGAYSIEAHQEVGVDLEKYGFNRIFLVGSYKEECKRGALSAGLPKEAISLCSNLDDTIAKTRQDLKKGDIVLVKGSRGMKMEFVAEALLQKSE